MSTCRCRRGRGWSGRVGAVQTVERIIREVSNDEVVLVYSEIGPTSGLSSGSKNVFDDQNMATIKGGARQKGNSSCKVRSSLGFQNTTKGILASASCLPPGGDRAAVDPRNRRVAPGGRAEGGRDGGAGAAHERGRGEAAADAGEFSMSPPPSRAVRRRWRSSSTVTVPD
jgi:hypothetical protein